MSERADVVVLPITWGEDGFGAVGTAGPFGYSTAWLGEKDGEAVHAAFAREHDRIRLKRIGVHYHSEEDARAACNAHHRAAVLALLEPVAVSAEPVAWRYASTGGLATHEQRAQLLAGSSYTQQVAAEMHPLYATPREVTDVAVERALVAFDASLGWRIEEYGETNGEARRNNLLAMRLALESFVKGVR